MPAAAQVLCRPVRLGPGHARGGAGWGRAAGFTLIELLVVLAIGALLVGLVPLAYGTLQEGSQYRDTVRRLVSELRQARQQALNTGQPVTYQVDLRQRQYGVLGDAPKAWPQGLEIRATVGQWDAQADPSLARIVFLPDGGASGGSFEVLRPAGGGTQVRVDWLLGAVTLHPVS
ncbi:MAG: prepilin-type N-terminal cleavage/methylation domain-containing protein [Rhodoferax sp.]